MVTVGQWRAAMFLGILLFVLAVPAGAQPQAADPQRGEALYVGTEAFEAGGAPCLGCHGIAGAGLAGGSNFGPDLTAIHENYGEEGVAFVLEDLASFPSMTPIYTGRPLTIAEQADLAAFLAGVAGRAPIQANSQVVAHGAMGALAVVALLFLFGWKRLTGVRRHLVAKARLSKGGLQ
ncbi:MAG: c-type cytochrome [Desulfuromonadales bacterium]